MQISRTNGAELSLTRNLVSYAMILRVIIKVQTPAYSRGEPSKMMMKSINYPQLHHRLHLQGTAYQKDSLDSPWTKEACAVVPQGIDRLPKSCRYSTLDQPLGSVLSQMSDCCFGVEWQKGKAVQEKTACAAFLKTIQNAVSPSVVTFRLKSPLQVRVVLRPSTFPAHEHQQPISDALLKNVVGDRGRRHSSQLYWKLTTHSFA